MMGRTVLVFAALMLTACSHVRAGSINHGSGLCVNAVSELGEIVAVPDGSKLYVADTFEPHIFAVSTTSFGVQTEIGISAVAKSIALLRGGAAIVIVSERDGAGFLDVIRTDDDHLTKTIPLGRGAFRRMAVADPNTVYLVRTDTPSLVKVDLLQDVVSASRLPEGTSDIAVGRDTIFLSGPNLWELNVVSGELFRKMDLPPSEVRLAVVPVKKDLVLFLPFGNDILFLDTKASTVLHRVSVGMGIEDVAFSPNGDKSYVTYKLAGITSRRDSKSGEIVGGIDFSPTEVVEIETSTGIVLRRLTAGLKPDHLTVAADGKVYVSTRDIKNEHYIAVIESHETRRIDVKLGRRSDSGSVGATPCSSVKANDR